MAWWGGGTNLISSTSIVSLWLWKAAKADSIFLLLLWGRLAEAGLVSIWGIMKSVSPYKHYSTLAAGPLLATPFSHPLLSPHRNVKVHDGSSSLILFFLFIFFIQFIKLDSREGLCCGTAAIMWKKVMWKWQTPGVPHSRQVRILTEDLSCWGALYYTVETMSS